MPDSLFPSVAEEAVSLLEFTRRIGNTLRAHPDLHNSWIIAELSDVAVRGGHFYADLIQKNEAGQTIARMRSNLWAGNYRLLSAKYFSERGEQLRNGIKVKIRGSATHHDIYGLSFNINDIDPSYVDEGDILRRRMEILQVMKDEGIFDNNHDLELPKNTQRIAVISAEGAAGLGDFINQLQNNPDNYRFDIRLFNSPMQGEKVPMGIITALHQIYGDISNWDCVVIIRGGGATADMNSFDDVQLARNVCYFPLPVIVGIGHERDNCVLDYIAHTRCKTPTAVAEFLISHQRQAWAEVCDKVNEIARYTTLHIDGEKQRITQYDTFIPSYLNQLLERENLRLRNLTGAIPLASNSITTREHTRLQGYRAQLEPAIAATLSRAKEKLRATFELLEVLKPENTLKRGYSITRIDGKSVRDASNVKPGTEIETQLASGSIRSTVK